MRQQWNSKLVYGHACKFAELDNLDCQQLQAGLLTSATKPCAIKYIMYLCNLSRFQASIFTSSWTQGSIVPQKRKAALCEHHHEYHEPLGAWVYSQQNLSEAQLWILYEEATTMTKSSYIKPTPEACPFYCILYPNVKAKTYCHHTLLYLGCIVGKILFRFREATPGCTWATSLEAWEPLLIVSFFFC